MADDTNTAERESFEAWFRREYHSRLDRNMPDKSYNDPAAHLTWIGWSARASLAASAGSDPVAPEGAWDNLKQMMMWSAFCGELQLDDALANIDEFAGLHPSPPEGMAGWTKASEQLPPCGDDQDFIGINTAGFAGVFNAVRVIDGNTYCLMETAEESVSIMSDLDVWKPFIRPPLPASEAKEL